MLLPLQVEKVREGYRLTLTYTLHRDAAPDPAADLLLPLLLLLLLLLFQVCCCCCR
jgi:hypothetical protein